MISTNVEQSKRITKRTVVSKIARLFGPLGLVAPIVLQQLYKLEWDWNAAYLRKYLYIQGGACVESDMRHLITCRPKTRLFTRLRKDLTACICRCIRICLTSCVHSVIRWKPQGYPSACLRKVVAMCGEICCSTIRKDQTRLPDSIYGNFFRIDSEIVLSWIN